MNGILKWIGILAGGLLGFVLLGAIVIVGSGVFLFDRQAAATVPAGYRHDAALYVTSRDGTKIAIDVFLPKTLQSGTRVPALIKATPYWRRPELSAIGKALAYYLAPNLIEEPDVTVLSARGYAVVVADARGTGASFGTLGIMFTEAEVEDYASVAAWITHQPWSNGKIGAYGFSYRGISAANMASLDVPSIKAVAPLFDLTDLYLLGNPGGVYAQYLLRAWGAQTRDLNLGIAPCAGDTVCEIAIRGPKPVDSDTDRSQLAQAFAAHRKSYNVEVCARAAPARDDVICSSGHSLDSVSLLARKAKVEARNLPMFVLTGWLDQSSPAQVLHRFNTFSNPQQVVLGPFTHGGFMGDDPFAPNAPIALTYRQQTEMMADFFDRYLKDKPGRPIAKSVRYYVIGAKRWETSPSWPPARSTPVKWYPGAHNTFTTAAPAYGSDIYRVDFSASTGPLSGYRGQVDLSQTNYGNRAKADRQLLVYTSPPLTADGEIAGNPVAHLKLASSARDGLLIVYLEDVAPDGTVTYVSQGVLRLAHRKLGASATSADALHSYARADMAEMKPGVPEVVTLAISPIAARFRRGHRMRIAIAGADASNLERMPARGEVTLTLMRGAETYIEIPAIPD